MRPGDVLVHPVALAATTLYAVNDWGLKALWPGVISGKLSDVAGMVVLPLTLLAVAELATGRVLGRRALWTCIAVTLVGFAAVEVWRPAELAWCWTWGALQWPFRAVACIALRQPVPAVLPCLAWSDPTDLLALPFGLLALAVRPGSCRVFPDPDPRPDRR